MKGHTATYETVYAGRMNAEFMTPVSQAVCFSRQTNQSPATLVSTLYVSCCPATIIWGIRFITIDSVKTCARWLWSHVARKVLEGMPTFYHANAATAVIFVFRCFGIIASMHHHEPTSVFGSRRLSMSQMRFTHFVATKATTTLRFSTFQPSTIVTASLTTIADALPSSSAVNAGRPRNDDKSAKSFSCQIY